METCVDIQTKNIAQCLLELLLFSLVTRCFCYAVWFDTMESKPRKKSFHLKDGKKAGFKGKGKKN